MKMLFVTLSLPLIIITCWVSFPSQAFGFERSPLWRIIETSDRAAARARASGDDEAANIHEERSRNFTAMAERWDRKARRHERIQRENRAFRRAQRENNQIIVTRPRTPAVQQRSSGTQWYQGF